MIQSSTLVFLDSALKHLRADKSALILGGMSRTMLISALQDAREELTRRERAVTKMRTAHWMRDRAAQKTLCSNCGAEALVSNTDSNKYRPSEFCPACGCRMTGRKSDN